MFRDHPQHGRAECPRPHSDACTAFAERSGYDSWTMFNVYPQISRNPAGIQPDADHVLAAENMHRIADHVSGRPLTVLATWGTLIDSRPYLRNLARDIAALPQLQACTWVQLGIPTTALHPRHPLYVNGPTPFEPFNVAGYSASA
ncbi:DUF1643 domain-containing protein [Leucobacter chromiireducens]|uniref:DUF1643 domain-containing protein n=1 Tax=Leucobacter chromiireducens TaxID=283877 RepID=UPI003CD08817